jgi:hypothetical protein
VTDLDALRKLTAQALNRLWQEMDIFLLDATGKYFGRLCHFNQCPKHKPQRRAEGCGRVRFCSSMMDSSSTQMRLPLSASRSSTTGSNRKSYRLLSRRQRYHRR